MPLLFFDVPNLWSPSTPPFWFKVDGFFVACNLNPLNSISCNYSFDQWATKWRQIFSQRKPRIAGLYLHPDLLLPGRAWMGWSKINFSRSDDKTLYRLHRHKSATAIDIHALMVTFFSIFTKITAGTCMCCVMTLRAMKHLLSLLLSVLRTILHHCYHLENNKELVSITFSVSIVVVFNI